jgi:ABC-type transporter Mla subunit MlaD
VAEDLPGFISQEREAIIHQFMQELGAQQQQMLALVTALKGALEAGTATSDSLQGTLRGLDEFLDRFPKKGEAPAPTAEPKKPFDIADYATAAREFAATAKQLESLVAQLNAGVPQVDQLASQTIDNMRSLVNFAFWRLVVLFLVLIAAALAAALAYRYISRRMGAQRVTEAGARDRI